MAADKRNERGAFLPEYALVFAVFAVGIVGVAQAIHDRTGEFYEASSSGIGAVPDYEVSRTTLGWSPTTTVPATLPTTTTTTTTSTTIPATTTSTTTSSSTTTTVTPPTTLAPTTTAPPVAYSFVWSLEDRSYVEVDGDWTARTRVTIHRADLGGVPLPGALVSGTFVTADGETNNGTCTADAGGKCDMSWSNRTDDDDPTTFTVTNVSSTPGWDGAEGSITLHKP